MNISLVPLAVHHLCLELDACQAIADPETENALSILIDKMLQDFNSSWSDACYYMSTTTRGARNRPVGIPTYHFWAMLLDPRTKSVLQGFCPMKMKGKDCGKMLNQLCGNSED